MTVAELNEYVRYFLDLTILEMDDTELNRIIQEVLDSGLATTECQEKYYSIKRVLEKLIIKQASASGSTGGSVGAVTKRKEKRGNSEIEINYSDNTGSISTATGYDKILEDFLKDPDSFLLCDVFPSTDSSAQGSVIIGGRGSNMFDTNTPWRQNMNARFNPKSRRF